MCEPCEGYVMVRRQHAMPFAIAVKELLNADKRPHRLGPFECLAASPSPLSDRGGTVSESVTPAEIVRMLCEACDLHSGGQKGWANDHGLSPAYVNDVLRLRREPTDAIASAFGFERRIIFVRRPK